MEAVDFFVEACKMCEKYSKLQCQGCPLEGSGCQFAINPGDPKSVEKMTGMIGKVEEWSKSNPQKTRLMAFLEVFPNALLSDGVVVIDPCDIEVDYCKSHGNHISCGDCREKYWNEVVE